jgi:hypothetical protein
MSSTDADYSAYISYHAMASNTFSLFMGFTFTAIVLLLTRIPDPSQIRIQTVLFFLVLLFQVLGYLLFEEEAVIAYCVKIAPQLPRDYRAGIVHHFSNFVWYMLTGIIALMFIVWDLVYLAIFAAIIGISFIILARVVSTPLYKKVEKWIRK